MVTGDYRHAPPQLIADEDASVRGLGRVWVVSDRDRAEPPGWELELEQPVDRL